MPRATIINHKSPDINRTHLGLVGHVCYGSSLFTFSETDINCYEMSFALLPPAPIFYTVLHEALSTSINLFKKSAQLLTWWSVPLLVFDAIITMFYFTIRIKYTFPMNGKLSVRERRKRINFNLVKFENFFHRSILSFFIIFKSIKFKTRRILTTEAA